MVCLTNLLILNKYMTIKELEKKVIDLENRIKVLENTRPMIYPYIQPYTYPMYPQTSNPIYYTTS